MKRAVVVVPVYRPFSASEKFSFRQCVEVLGGYDIVVLSPESLDLSECLKPYPGVEEKRLDGKWFRSVETYNSLLLTPDFYRLFSDYEYMLIYQLDAFVFRDALDEWIDKGYDYVGAPWIPNSGLYQSTVGELVRRVRRLLHPAGTTQRVSHAQMHWSVGNGGFSLRRIAKMEETVLRFQDEISRLKFGEKRAQEDVFFSIYIRRRAGIKVPGWRDALGFSFENNPTRCLRLNRGQLPFGCHYWSKGRVWKEFWSQFIACDPALDGNKAIKEITVFCEQGDSAKISTWSNVPYFLTETLIEKGIKVNRVNLHPGANRWHKVFYKLWNVFAKGVFRRPSYRNSDVYYTWAERQIGKAVERYNRSDAFVFTTFSMTARRFTGKPVVLFCDWTVDYKACAFQKKTPDSLSAHSRRLIERQERCIEGADCVISLFPGVADYMKQRYRNPNIHYIGNVVNSLTEADRSKELPLKKAGCDILFVGKKHYLKGAKELLAAFGKLRERIPDVRLHIIGMNAKRLGQIPEGVSCYGYLDKGNAKTCGIYYDLLAKCRLFINTTPDWGAFSASVEAMYHHTPVIVTPYSEFVNTFGREIAFGIYHEPESGADALCREMADMLSDYRFEERAVEAHRAVEDMTWANFVDRLLEHCESAGRG